MELVITGYAGESGSLRIYQNEESKKKLLDRYPKSFFDVWEEKLGSEPDYVTWGHCKGVVSCELCSPGGVYGALWTLLRKEGLGASFSQRLIPVRQQTVEICEMTGADPYRLEAANTCLWLCEDSGPLKKHFPQAVTIGYTEPGPAIKRIDGAVTAYLRKS